MTEFVLRIIFHIIYGCLLWSSQHMVLVLLIINYPNRDIFLIFLIQTSLLTTSKSEQNCYTVFLLHVTISPQAGVNPISSIIKQSRRSHRWWGLLQAPVVFSCFTSPSQTFQPFDLWGSVSHTWHSYTPKG